MCVRFCFTCCKIYKDGQKASPTVITNMSEKVYREKWSRKQFNGRGSLSKGKKQKTWETFDKYIYKVLNAMRPSFSLVQKLANFCKEPHSK